MIISGRARLAGVMGWPVAHSLSPRLHNYWLERYALDGAYVPLPVPPERFAEAFGALSALGFAGVNVTVPHKEAALAAVDEADDLARRIGAVNTVVVRADGRLEGRNTDGLGFVENLRHEAPRWRSDAGPAVVLGAGGAARALCVALLDAGVPEVRLSNRTRSRADRLAAEFGGAVGVVAWEDRGGALPGAALVVNTTTLGMEGQPPLDIDLAGLPAGAVVADLIYRPLRTPLLERAARRGNPVVDGLGMLIHQARPGFAAWFGRSPAVTPELRAFLIEDLAPVAGGPAA